LLNIIEASPLSTSSPIRLKLTIGDVEAEIECEESQLQSAVEKVVTALQKQSETLSKISNASLSQRSVPRKQTCKTIILELWKEGWFSISRNLREVHDEMGRRGYHYDRSAVAHTLVDLVREGILTRQGGARQYRYVQKRPPH
jgi:hypothetical protein